MKNKSQGPRTLPEQVQKAEREEQVTELRVPIKNGPRWGELIKNERLQQTGQARPGVTRVTEISSYKVLWTLEKKVSVRRKWPTMKQTQGHLPTQRQWSTLLIFRTATDLDFNQPSHAGHRGYWSICLKSFSWIHHAPLGRVKPGLDHPSQGLVRFCWTPFLACLLWSLQRKPYVVHMFKKRGPIGRTSSKRR